MKLPWGPALTALVVSACLSLCVGSSSAAPGAADAFPLVAEAAGPVAVAGPEAAPTVRPRPRVRASGAASRISASRFGIHSYQGRPEIPAGAFRINCYPRWNTMNPARGVYNWRVMDANLRAVRSYGYRDILFSFCGTPKWAADRSHLWPGVQPYFGTYSASPPLRMEYWREFVARFAKRYAGRISSYEVWNEATSPYLWQGTPDQMAEMTAIAYREIHAADPRAKVVTANSQTGEQPAWFTRFFPAYMKGLQARHWPVDAVSFHTYAGFQGTQEPEPLTTLVRQRPATLRAVLRAVRRARLPDQIPLWDTETNYLGSFAAADQESLVAHTYLDSWRYGVERTYWYMWALSHDAWLGVPMRPGQPGVRAYAKLVRWTRGARFSGCRTRHSLVICRFERSGERFTIVYSTRYSGTHPYRTVRGSRACPFTAASCHRAYDVTRVGFVPVKFVPPSP